MKISQKPEDIQPETYSMKPLREFGLVGFLFKLLHLMSMLELTNIHCTFCISNIFIHTNTISGHYFALYYIPSN